MNADNSFSSDPDSQPSIQSDKRRKIIIGTSVVVGMLLLLGLVGQFSDLMGARLIRQGSPRLVVYQGETVTMEIPSSDRVQKLEICDDKETRILFGYRDFKSCSTLSYSINPGTTQATVRIPTNYEGRAVVVVRQRGSDNRLLTIAPRDAKIALWVNKARSQPVQQAASDGDSGDGGGGGGSNSGGGGSSDSNLSATPEKITTTIEGGCVDNNDSEVHVSWQGLNIIAKHRKAGESSWRSSQSNAYSDYDDNVRTALLFNVYSTPPYTASDRLRSGDEFEIQLYPTGSHPNPSIEPSDVYRFTTPDLSQGFWTECIDF